MNSISKILFLVLIWTCVFALFVWLVGPYEDADLTASFDDSQLDEGVDTYFATSEARYDDITPGVQKQAIWAGAPEVETAWSVLYVHGFSATAQEIRPVPDDVANALGANLILTRLAGHGRSSDAMAEGSVPAWMGDVAEGLAVARKTGDRVLVISTSTGGTLMAAAAMDEKLMQDVAGIVMISPNFGVNNPLASLLTWPAARYWLPKLAGERRSFEPANEGQATYWTTEYPSFAAMPMGALIKAVNTLDLRQTKVPALFWFSPDDQVVRPDVTVKVAQKWGGPVTVVNPVLGAQDDAFAHVIAGDILSPSQTGVTVRGILEWVKGL